MKQKANKLKKHFRTVLGTQEKYVLLILLLLFITINIIIIIADNNLNDIQFFKASIQYAKFQVLIIKNSFIYFL